MAKLEQSTPKLIMGDIFNGRIDESWKIFQGNTDDKKYILLINHLIK